MSELAISHERLIAVLERRLHAATSELAMKDAAIEQLQEELDAAMSSGAPQAPRDPAAQRKAASALPA